MQDFIHRGPSALEQPDGVILQRLHAVLNRDRGSELGSSSTRHQSAQVRVHAQDFVNANASAIARARALITAPIAVKGELPAGIEAEILK